ncbi:MAG: YcxB family protein [Bacillota bacterium]
MKISFDLTREDYWGLNRFHLFHSRRSRLTYAWLSLLLVGGFTFQAYRLGLEPVAAVLVAALFVSGVMALALWNIKRRVMKFPAGKWLGQTTLEINETGISVQNAVTETHTSWRGVFTIINDPHYFFIYTEKNSSLVIPKRAFPDASATKQFFDTAVRNWRVVEPAAAPNRVP